MDEKELKQEIQTIDQQMNSIIITKDTYESASQLTIAIDGIIKKITDYWADPIKKAHEAHKALTDKRNEMLKPIENKKKSLRQKISAYLTEQDRIRREEQARLDEERKRQEETERAKLEKKLEKAERKGQAEKAEDLREQIDDVFVTPTIIEPEIEKTTRTDSGTVTQIKDIKIEIIDSTEIYKAIVNKQLPSAIAEINIVKLKKYIKDMKFQTFPGCKVIEIVKAVFRGK